MTKNDESSQIEKQTDGIDARQLIFDLFAARPPRELSLPALARAGTAFGISEGALRTALARLKREGRVAAAQRGSYVLVGAPAPIQRRIVAWRQVLARRRPWEGAWIVAIPGTGTRADRTSWRRTLRAFALEGLRQFDANVFVRPDNLEGGASALGGRLGELGVPETVIAGSMSDLPASVTRRWVELWPVASIERGHTQLAERLRRSMQRLAGRADRVAAAETLLLGRKAVRAILEDPLLPAELGSDAALRALIAAMSEYDTFGKSVWAAFLEAGGEARRG